MHSRNALLLLTKAQPFQRPRQQPQQLQQSSRCYRQQLSQQSNQPSAAARTHVLLQEFRFYGDWFRHGLVHSWSHWPGRSLCHRLCGYPAWSRECKSTSGSSGAEAGSRTVTGDGSSVGGSGEGLPLVRGANPHFLPEAPPLRVFGLGWGRRWCGSSLLAPGQEGRTEAGSDVGQCSATSFPSPSPIQLYPAGPANVSPAPAPLWSGGWLSHSDWR